MNSKLKEAKKNKNDEFYTQLADIDNELKHYKNHFKDKIVYCNCDDPKKSNFWKYFQLNFKSLGLKKLISTHFSINKPSYKLEYAGNKDSDGNLILVKNPLLSNGDFRSLECIEILKEADIVVTNPPFSLFREYVLQLSDYNKKFLIIGHQNAISYKEIFKLIQDNRMWLGYGFKRSVGHFINDHYEDYATDIDHKEGMIRVSGVNWFTNLEIEKRSHNLVLSQHYNKDSYPHYDNYDAINVNIVKDIPNDYYGLIGVPITFINKHNPEQFEIIGIDRMLTYQLTGKSKRFCINNKELYARIVIKRKL